MFFYAEQKKYFFTNIKEKSLSTLFKFLKYFRFLFTLRLEITFTIDVVYTCFDSGDTFYILFCFNVTWFSHKQ